VRNTADGILKSGRTFNPANIEIPVKSNGYTQSYAKLGTEVHELYKVGMADNVNTFKEFKLPSGKKVDFIDFNTKTIYELKPHNPASINNGIAQANAYLREVESIYGSGWKIVVDTY